LTTQSLVHTGHSDYVNDFHTALLLVNGGNSRKEKARGHVPRVVPGVHAGDQPGTGPSGLEISCPLRFSCSCGAVVAGTEDSTGEAGDHQCLAPFAPSRDSRSFTRIIVRCCRSSRSIHWPPGIYAAVSARIDQWSAVVTPSSWSLLCNLVYFYRFSPVVSVSLD
jgi:hypothetical protein